MGDRRQRFKRKRRDERHRFWIWEKEFQSPKLVSCTLYSHDLRKMLREQVFKCPSDEFSTIWVQKAFLYTHVMLILKKACTAVERFIKFNDDVLLSWKACKEDGVASFVGSLQLFSFKSQNSLSDGALQFYRLEATLLNFSERRRRALTCTKLTFVAYLPVHFEINDSTLVQNRFLRYKWRALQKQMLRKIFMNVLNTALNLK